jgi:hypothetical protein
VQTLVETDRIPLRSARRTATSKMPVRSPARSRRRCSRSSASPTCSVGTPSAVPYAHESDEEIGKKIDAVLRNNMSPILCVGESAEARAAGDAEQVVADQLAAVVTPARRQAISRFVVAYEPIWAIGTGVTATEEDAEAMCAHIHRELDGLAGVRRRYPSGCSTAGSVTTRTRHRSSPNRRSTACSSGERASTRRVSWNRPRRQLVSRAACFGRCGESCRSLLIT